VPRDSELARRRFMAIGILKLASTIQEFGFNTCGR
jgi:hypothetical protein